MTKKAYNCDNCGTNLQGEFCHACGQSVQVSSRYFGTILMELLDNLFSYDSRVYRTLIPLMFKPGYVCKEYLAGKRLSFLPPFRLYLFASVIFFLLAPFVFDISMSLNLDNVAGNTTAQTEEPAGFIRLNKDESSYDVVGIASGEPDEVDTDFPYFIEERRLMREKIYGFGDKDDEALLDTALSTLPTLMFFLLPLLAVTLKLLYLFSKRYYMEHLIVVLYSQSFVFFMLLFASTFENTHNLLAEKYPDIVVLHNIVNMMVQLAYLWIPIHVFLFMKRVYAQSYAMTLVKFTGMTLVYLGLIATTVSLTIIWGIFKI
ncbi:MAG: DUF3667 domain-containing protein [Gammaproteobacteria bacterium]|nr:DUF3667 domain-containing protein [Gammaproteobacteria bacterium]